MSLTFEQAKPALAFIAQTGNSEKQSEIESTLKSATEEAFLRKMSAEIRNQQQRAAKQQNKDALDSLLLTSEERLAELIDARLRVEKVRESLKEHDPAFSETLATEIEFVAATTDEAVLKTLLSRIEGSSDQKSLRNAVKKLADVRKDLKYSPTSQIFVDKKLSASKWRNQLRQIEVALETQILEAGRRVREADIPGPSLNEILMYVGIAVGILLAILAIVGIIFWLTRAKNDDSKSETYGRVSTANGQQIAVTENR